MQTDIILSQLLSSLEDLKKNIDGFEKQSTPHVHHAEQLYSSISKSHKLISAFLVLKQQQDLSPDLNLHLKLMSIPVAEEKELISGSIVEIKTEPISVQPIIENTNHIVVEQEIVAKPTSINPNKIAVNINDKFRFINELFKSNSNEYNIAIEQLNAANSMDEVNAYLTGLKSIYEWNDDHEMVKKLFAISHKRFS
jgi:hypothetical protein